MTQQALERIISRVKQLPALPEVAGRLMELLGDPGSSIEEVNALISRDPALTATIIKLVNSSYYGLRKQVASLSRALSLLGFRTVKNIVLTAAATGLFETSETSDLFHARDFARHSVAQAVVCRYLARYSGCCDPETAFAAGLLHDIGKLLTDIAFHDRYSQIAGLARRENITYYEAETEVWELDHAAIGALLAKYWHFPPLLCDAIRHHHSLEEESTRDISALNMLSDYFATVKKTPCPNSFGSPMINREVWGELRLETQALPALLRELQNEVGLANDIYLITAAAG